jgi:hypothetical protein
MASFINVIGATKQISAHKCQNEDIRAAFKIQNTPLHQDFENANNWWTVAHTGDKRSGPAFCSVPFCSIAVLETSCMQGQVNSAIRYD